MLAFVGLGANLGDALVTVRQAIDALGQLPNTRLVARSRLYRSAPVEASGPDFINAVVALDTTQGAQALFDQLQHIETAAGRERSYRNAPRTLDLDLLLYGDERIEAAHLTVPHPRMHLRAFVLRPLLDIDPAIAVPGRGPARELLSALPDQHLEPLEP